MAMVPPDPYAGRPRGPRIIPVGARPNGEVPGGGLTLDALMARQKEIAGRPPTQMSPMISPWQGAASLAEGLVQGLQQRRADTEAKEGRAALAQAMTQFDPNTGEFSPEAQATMAALAPEQYMDSLKTLAASRQRQRELETSHGWEVEGREDTQKSAADLAAQSQAATAEQNDLNRKAEDARARQQEAATAGRQDDAQAAAQELAQLNARLDQLKTEAAAKSAAAQPQTDTAKIEADFKAGRISEQERDAAIAKATYVAPTETYGDVITGDAASKQGLDPTKQWQQNRTSGKWEIAGGSGISLNLPPAEMAARIALGDEFQKGVPQLLEDIKAGEATGLLKRGEAWAGWGRAGQIERQVMSGVDALVRHLTGAGKSSQEAEEYATRYMPTKWDTSDSLRDKITRLDAELSAIKAGVMQGRGGGTPDQAAAAGTGDEPDKEGEVATGPNGEKIVFRNGKWVPQ